MTLIEEQLSKYGSLPGLDRISELMELLGNPQKKMKVILVTGTNGKGSVTTAIASMLSAAGYNTGSYFSPAVYDHRERFQINGACIPEKTYKKYERLILNIIRKNSLKITVFEAQTAIAYCYFADKKVDYAVMEIGMGGRLDATNIAREKLAIITNVDYDHEKFLGRTIKKIAVEKAGIIKSGTAITGASGVALATIEKIAKERGKKLRVLGKHFFCRLLSATDKETIINYHGKRKYNNVVLSLLGKHQCFNAALAIAAAEQLHLPEAAIRRGLKAAFIPGRLEIISRRPLIVLDGAHNPHGIKALLSSLDIFKYKNLIVVFAVMKDKNWKEMIRSLAPHADLFIATQPMMERAEKASFLAKEASHYTTSTSIPSVQEAIQQAKKSAGKSDMVLVCGSLYMLAEAKGFKI